MSSTFILFKLELCEITCTVSSYVNSVPSSAVTFIGIINDLVSPFDRLYVFLCVVSPSSFIDTFDDSLDVSAYILETSFLLLTVTSYSFISFGFTSVPSIVTVLSDTSSDKWIIFKYLVSSVPSAAVIFIVTFVIPAFGKPFVAVFVTTSSIVTVENSDAGVTVMSVSSRFLFTTIEYVFVLSL